SKSDAYWLRPMTPGSPGLLSLNGRTYSVLRLSQTGYRLLSDVGMVYDVGTTDPDGWKCSCPNFAINHDGKENNPCEHVLDIRTAVARLGMNGSTRGTKPPAE